MARPSCQVSSRQSCDKCSGVLLFKVSILYNILIRLARVIHVVTPVLLFLVLYKVVSKGNWLWMMTDTSLSSVFGGEAFAQ